MGNRRTSMNHYRSVSLMNPLRESIMENPGIDPGASRMQSERSPV